MIKQINTFREKKGLIKLIEIKESNDYYVILSLSNKTTANDILLHLKFIKFIIPTFSNIKDKLITKNICNNILNYKYIPLTHEKELKRNISYDYIFNNKINFVLIY